MPSGVKRVGDEVIYLDYKLDKPYIFGWVVAIREDCPERIPVGSYIKFQRYAGEPVWVIRDWDAEAQWEIETTIYAMHFSAIECIIDR
jgi:hypothetical protein